VATRLVQHTARGLPGGAVFRAEAVRHTIDWAGPIDAQLPSERAVQAACGLMHVHGRATGGPLPLAVDYASAVTGVLAAAGTTAALVGRARGLKLSEVRASVAQGALLAISQYLAAATACGAGGPEESPLPAGAAATPGGLATLVSADGARVEIETLDPFSWREFWARLGVPPAVAGRGWLPFQQRFAHAVCPLPDGLRQAARRSPLTLLRAAAQDTEVSLLVIGSDPHPPVGPDPWRFTPGPAPGPGSHALTALPPGAAGHGGSLPLAGLRVVESTRRVQGPLAGHVLRMLGAEVVRIEPPGGDPMRWLAPLAGDCSVRFAALNAGKPVAEADLTTAQGRDTVRDLASAADVFLHNWAPGKAPQWELDAADLLPGRPALVYAGTSGFGDTFGDRPPMGTDYLAQVHSGLAAAVRPAGTPPAPSLMTLTDVLGGLVCAQGVTAALLARELTGHGGRVDSSLVSAAALVPRPGQRAHWTVLDRALPTADGHLYLGDDARSRPDAVLRIMGGGEFVAARFATRTTAEWTERLAQAGLSATPVLTDLTGLVRDFAFRAAIAPPDPAAGYAYPYSPWEFA
jgi:crotonobetainyl-CoA:carnitine CoA-transferase CaiB-like acyl-CoA transferase